MSLEVDRCNDLPIPRQPEKGTHRHQDENESHGDMYPAAGDNASPRQQNARQRSTIMLLSIALAAMTVLAVIAAGLGGGLAARRGRE